MKKVIFTIFAGITAISSYAQISVKDTVFATMPTNSEKGIDDTLINTGNFDVPVEWLVSPSSIVAPGHSGVAICFLPGQCYGYDNSIHNDTVYKSAAAIIKLDWKMDATTAKGSTSYIILNTDISGGKDLVIAVTAGNPLSTDQLDAQAFNIYPQPAADILNVEVPYAKTSKVEIVNISGAIVKATPTNGNPKTEINIGNLNTGLYFVHIYNNENKIIARKKISKN